MTLPPDAIIAAIKITEYLLQWRPENDKSQFLAQAGYTLAEPEQLEKALREQLLPLNATFDERTEYGDKYRICGSLTGPNGRTLRVVSIWMVEKVSGKTKFITLYPEK